MCIRDRNHTSEGVKDYMGAEVISKGAKFYASDFSDIDFTAIQLSNRDVYKRQTLISIRCTKHQNACNLTSTVRK